MDFAADGSGDSLMRREALDALRTWNHPPPRERVEGGGGRRARAPLNRDVDRPPAQLAVVLVGRHIEIDVSFERIRVAGFYQPGDHRLHLVDVIGRPGKVIDVVDADAGSSDSLQPVSFVDYRRRDLGLAADDQGIIIPDDRF